LSVITEQSVKRLIEQGADLALRMGGGPWADELCNLCREYRNENMAKALWGIAILVAATLGFSSWYKIHYSMRTARRRPSCRRLRRNTRIAGSYASRPACTS